MMTSNNRHFSGDPKKSGDSDYEKNFASFLDKSKDKSGPTLEEQLKDRELKNAE
jgi:hypothetical protein